MSPVCILSKSRLILRSLITNSHKERKYHCLRVSFYSESEALNRNIKVNNNINYSLRTENRLLFRH